MDNPAFEPDIDRASSSSSSDQAFEDNRSSLARSIETQPININRPIFYTEDFYKKKEHSNKKRKNSFFHCLGSHRCLPARVEPSPIITQNKSIFIKWLQTLIPICYWLPNYKFNEDLFPDLIAGITILALHIPQGLAYGKLAGVEPINGLYVSLFPVIIYSIFGTGRQVSIGTFAVISIACNDALEAFDLNHDIVFRTINKTSIELDEPLPSGIEILTTLCLMVGFIQFLLGFLQLGILAIILSETLISAFVTACSIHVFTSQIFALIDIDSTVKEDDYEMPIPFDIIHTYYRFFSRIGQANLITLAISASCIIALVTTKYGLEPWITKRFNLKNFIIPIDILVIVITTLISELLNLKDVYGVHVIPKIPKAFEGMPQVPQLGRFFPRLYGAAILITVVSYVSTFSLGKIFAKKHGYEISANQELIALGASNIFSSFFLCYPCSGSLARSAVMDKVGARTQLASLVSSVFMVLFLLYFSGYLRSLPKSVLSCIIIVALYSTMKQIKEAKTAWHISKLDGILWIATFTFVILFGVGHGLLYSVLFSFIILIIRLSIPIIKLKNQVKGSDVFVEIDHIYDTTGSPLSVVIDSTSKSSSQQHSTVVILEFQGPLLFINSVLLKNRFHSMIGRYLIRIPEKTTEFSNHQTPNLINTIILDCTRMTYVDGKGAETILELVQNCQNYGIRFLLAACSQAVYDSLKRNGFFEKFNTRHCFMSVIDAISDEQRQF